MIDWHTRFLQQADWTCELREYLFAQVGMDTARRILEVGCGTGAILSDVAMRNSAAVHGLDLASGRLSEARLHAPRALLTRGDALTLPYPDQIFDISFCHFLLLWVREPLQALLEMKRVTRPGGQVLALAEPDYSRRVDKPAVLIPLGRWQTESLRRQGADPSLGERLAKLFHQADIQLIETGTLRGRGAHPLTAEQRELEWAVLEADLAGFIPTEEIQKMKTLDEQAWERGERVLFVPTYFAWGVA